MSYILEFNNSQSTDLVSNFRIKGVEKHIFNLVKNKKLTCTNINRIKNNKKNIITIQDFFADRMKVEDVHRYNLRIAKGRYPILNLLNPNNKYFLNSKFNDDNVMVNTEAKSIVFILESPHKDEYKYDKNLKAYIPIAPAQSKTGGRIEENICIVLNEIINNPRYTFSIPNGTYKVIMCNPVQFQTSLYYLHGKGLSNNKMFSKLRDDIWCELFNNQPQIETNFITRINSYNPKLILNGCTKTCKDLVRNSIRNNLPNIDYCEISHPSTWGNFDIK